MWWNRTALRRLEPRIVLSLWQVGTTRQKLKAFIQNNGLYIKQDVMSVIEDSKDNRRKRAMIQVSTKIRFRKIRQDNGALLLHIQLLKNGSSLDDKLDALTNQLQALFHCELISITNYVDFVEYVLCIRKSDTAKDAIDVAMAPLNADTGRLTISDTISVDYRRLPHFLITGNSGSGKSYFSYYLLWQMVREAGSKSVFVCDAKFDEMRRRARHWKIENVAESVDEINDYVRLFDSKMECRYQQDNPGKFDSSPMFLVIDEYAAWIGNLNKKEREELTTLIRNIILKGRAVNVHVCLILQRADSRTLDLSIRDNCSVRVAMGNVSKQLYEMVFGILPDASLTKKERGQGRILIDGEAVTPFEAPLLKM